MCATRQRSRLASDEGNFRHIRAVEKLAAEMIIRICPGLHFVDMALFINFASILHVFNISPPVDGNGAVLPLEAEFAETSTNS